MTAEETTKFAVSSSINTCCDVARDLDGDVLRKHMEKIIFLFHRISVCCVQEGFQGDAELSLIIKKQCDGNFEGILRHREARIQGMNDGQFNISRKDSSEKHF